MTAYLHLIDRTTQDPNKYLDVWLATVQCFDCYVRSSWIVRLGTSRLRDWWRAVECRDTLLERSGKTLDVELAKCRRMIVTLRGQDCPDDSLISDLEDLVNELGNRLATYLSQVAE